MEEQTQSFDFETHRLKAIAEYQKLRPLFGGIAEVVKKILDQAFAAKNV